MNDPNCFSNFIENVLGMTGPRHRNALLQFISTFSQLLVTTEDEIDTFVTTTHGANSGRSTNQKILIPPNVVIGLKSILFELNDRAMCGALPTLATLNGITMDHVNSLRQARSEEKAQLKRSKDNALTDNMSIPKFKSDNYDEFMTAFSSLVARKYGANDIPLDYLLRENEAPANYNAAFANRNDKIKNCILLTGDRFRIDSETLYSLYVEHIGTTGHGSNTVNRFKQSRNGFLCHRAFLEHYANRAYLDNRATNANKAIANAVYHGPKRNFTIETYYFIMSAAFNDLDNAGVAHALNDEQKIMKFKTGLRDSNAIKFALQAKATYDGLPAAAKNFEAFYNEFSSLMTEFSTLTGQGKNANIRTASINASITNNNSRSGNRGRGGRGRGRNSRGRGRNSRGRGRGRGNNRYEPYSSAGSFVPNYGQFKPEARIYPQHEYNAMSYHQQQAIGQLKQSEGWIDQVTPPPGFTIDNNTGFAIPSGAIINAFRTASINQARTNRETTPPPSIINLPPPPNASNPPNQPNESDTLTAGSFFGRSGTRNNQQQPTSLAVSAVSINGQPYRGDVYDANGNRLA